MKIIIVTILVLFCFNANAIEGYEKLPYNTKKGWYKHQSVMINGEKMKYKDVYDIFYKKLESLTKKQVLYIPPKTMICRSREQYIEAYKYRMAYNHRVKGWRFREMGCATSYKGFGFQIGSKKDSTIVEIVFQAPKAGWDNVIKSAFIDIRDVMTVEQFEQRVSIK